MKYWRSANFSLLLLVAWLVLTGIYQAAKPLPTGISQAWPVRYVAPEDVHFLADRTFATTGNGPVQRHLEQHIFDEIFSMIEAAERHIVADMFLYNDWQGSVPAEHRKLAAQFTQALIEKKSANPAMPVVVVTDPINEAYGGAAPQHLEQLKQAGVEVIITNLKPLRDSNPAFSAPWRTFLQWFGNSLGGGALPHPFNASGENVTARTWLTLLNFKANHRKVVIADEATLVTSANPHDGSSAHSNIAIKINSPLFAADAIASEQAVARFSNGNVPAVSTAAGQTGDTAAQLLTEEAIRQHLVELISSARAGDSIDMAMFYLSERSIVNALLQAAERDVSIRLILDPNKDAFGHTKNGVPNRPVAHELITKSNRKINIRWCATHGEQCHAKMILLNIRNRQHLIAGSANLTRRNINDYNLETNVSVSAHQQIPAIASARSYFEEMWTNQDGRLYTADYSTSADASLLKTVLYRVQEFTGLSSF